MVRPTHSKSDVFDVIRDINQTIAEMEREVDNHNNVADSCATHTTALRNTFSAPDSTIWRLFDAAANLNRSAGCRTHDIEIVLSESRVERLIRQVQLVAFTIEVGDFKLVATPVGSPAIRWSDTRLCKPDCLLFDSKWALSGSGTSPQTVLLRVELQFLTVGEQGSLRMTQTQSPRICDEGGRSIDPLAQVPMRDALRAQARQHLFAEIALMVSSIQITLPDNPLGTGPAQFQPLTYLISNDHLVLICRQLAKRRAPAPLGFRLFGQYDQGLRLKKEHIIPQISKKITDRGASLGKVEFQTGSIFVSAHEHRDDGCLWVDVDVDVWFEYRLVVLQDAPGVLFCDLNWLRWGSRIDIDRCWPRCGAIMDQVKDQIKTEVPKYYHLTFLLADLRATTRSATARIEPYGLTIMMKTR